VKLYVPGTPIQNYRPLYTENVWDGPEALEERVLKMSPVIAALWQSKASRKFGTTIGEEVFKRVNLNLADVREARAKYMASLPINDYGYTDEIIGEKRKRLEKEREVQKEAEELVMSELIAEVQQDVVMGDAASDGLTTVSDEGFADDCVADELELERILKGKNPISFLYENFGQRVVFGDGGGFPFEFLVYIDGKEVCRGFGQTKKEAKTVAAEKAVLMRHSEEKKGIGVKRLCLTCNFMVNPDGHEERCNVKVESVEFSGPKFILGKFMGDRVVSLHIGLVYASLVQAGKFSDEKYGNLTVWGSIQWSNTKMADYARSHKLRVDQFLSDHSVGDQFEYLYLCERQVRIDFLNYVANGRLEQDVLERISDVAMPVGLAQLWK